MEEKERISAAAAVAVEEEEREFGEIRVFVEEFEASGVRE